jgi:deoxyribodipyrimidine photolyase-related protein
VRKLLPYLSKMGFTGLTIFDVVDYNLEKRITEGCKQLHIDVNMLDSPNFINSRFDLQTYFAQYNKYFQTDFYVYSRKLRKVLIDEKEKPLQGKWSFDADNRNKYPKDKKPPKVNFVVAENIHQEAIDYVAKNFSSNFGLIDKAIAYPITHKQAQEWLHTFLASRFDGFGEYEDAIVADENILHHSVLTPMLNIGLLKPMQIIDEAILFANKNNISFNTLEGFVRQILGWREFVRAMYNRESVAMRTKNFWNFNHKMPKSFYDGTIGVLPVDDAIKKLNKSAYNHHIERLMILGNFMLLCEIKPTEVYQWFMEMYIDAFDWVMVPNVYGMSQFADGGLMCTKPYISGSNYIFKMSDYKKQGEWPAIWDGLFWRFMHVHRNFFLQNPRLGMLIRTFDKMSEEKKSQHLEIANNFLKQLHQQ